jgi:FkbM family methyltransferase
MQIKLLPIPIRRFIRKFLQSQGIVLYGPGPNLHTVMERRPEVEVATVIDVGASDGHWSADMMMHRPKANYLLVEAHEKHHGEALRKFKSEHRNVEYELCAAGDTNGEVHFLESSDPFAGAAGHEQHSQNDIVVPMKTVDSMVEKYGLRGPFLLKLDTHGFEVPILEGARQTLAEASMLIVEVYNFTLGPGALRFYEICPYLERLGFRCADVFDLLQRPGDKAFWQMDMVFLPVAHGIFQSNRYLPVDNA